MPVGIFDPFDHYVNIDDPGVGVRGSWSVTTLSGDDSLDLVSGFNGNGQALRFTGNEPFVTTVRRGFPPTQQISMSIGFKRTTSILSDVQDVIFFTNAAFTSQCYLHMNIGNYLELRGPGGIIATANFLLAEDVQYTLSLKIDLTTPGDNSFKMWANGNVLFDVSGVDLASASDDILGGLTIITGGNFGDNDYLVFELNHVYLLYDEFIDLPEIELAPLPASGDIVSDWTPSTGADNYAMIDDMPVDSDTTYNSSSTVGHQDIFDHDNLVRVPETILCVSTLTCGRKEESATKTVKPQLRIAGVDHDGPNYNMSQTYTFFFGHWQTNNPETALPWTSTDLDNLQSGYELVA